jgi:DnaJ-class molecular chaperone
VAVTYKDYYKTLGVPKTADAKAIKQAYRKLARKYHPDQNQGNTAAAERFKEINEANEVLSDPEKRQRYDTLGPDWARYAETGAGGFGGRPGTPGGSGPGGYRVHVDQSGGLGDFSEFFRTIFGDLGARGRPFEGVEFEERDPFRGGGRGQRGGDLEGEVEITLEEAHAGTRRTFEFQQLEPCATCHGTGRQGKGACPTCGGSGRVPRSNRVEVKIPAGVRDGSRVRAAGEGGTGSGGGTRGDLYLRVRVTPHELFERREDDLHVELPIAAWEAALGAEIEVPTLRGKVSMKVPPETSSGRTFRLPGYGLPHVKGGRRGDQFVRVRIAMPRDLTAEERALFEQLRNLRPAPPREPA